MDNDPQSLSFFSPHEDGVERELNLEERVPVLEKRWNTPVHLTRQDTSFLFDNREGGMRVLYENCGLHTLKEGWLFVR